MAKIPHIYETGKEKENEMKPIDFDKANCTYVKDQPEYMPLPAQKKKGAEGEVISVWKPTFKERVKLLFGSNIGLSMWTFNGPLTPSRVFISEYKEKKGD